MNIFIEHGVTKREISGPFNILGNRADIMSIVAQLRMLKTTDRNRTLEACAMIADKLAEHHQFYESGYDVGKHIAKRIRRMKDVHRPSKNNG